VAYYMVKAYLAARGAADAPAKPTAGSTTRRRARHPAKAEEARPGTFIGNDPATEVNEAWVEE
jgi:hypothetical protein